MKYKYKRSGTSFFKRNGNGIFLILLLVITAVTIACIFAPSSQNRNKSVKEKNSSLARSSSSSKLNVYFLDVGQGDSAVIECDGHTMIVDGGGAEYSDYIYSFLKKHNFKNIDYVVASHPGSDHIGGLSAVFHFTSVENVLCSCSEYDSASFTKFKKTVTDNNLEIRVPQPGDAFNLGSAEVTVLGPHYDTDNSSVVLRIVFGGTSFLLTGDSEMNEEESMVESGLSLRSTVLKAGHHGSNTSTTQRFIDSVRPEYVVISVGGDNQYGHPVNDVLQRIQASGAALYRTDMNGLISMTSDGTTISVITEKSPDCSPFTAAGGYKNMLAEERAVEEQERIERSLPAPTESDSTNSVKESNDPPKDYVVNTKSRKFHYPDCSSVADMKEANKWYYTGERSYLISQDYAPCGKCKP